jgi:hypothetical protein
MGMDPSSDAAYLIELIDEFHQHQDADVPVGELPDDTDWRAALGAARSLINALAMRIGHDHGDGSTIVALTVEGLDLYVTRSSDGSRVSVSVGTDELPAGVEAVVEANDGMSWEQPLP